ncbi:hypothetical protein Taro_039937 [Colocasia esculenta]|uniref:BHLH domain-containing protein n=1 Tax=Colocasia esculenta TaxID=4460 RepID=A0A843W7P6_COLES|nr:hypothetical protein [Colocasia esculenta]
MFGSPATSKDLNLPFSLSPFKQGKDESGLNHHHQQQQQMTNGLLRYRSAPSSLLGEMCEDFLPHRSSSPEAETMLARFMSPDLQEQIAEKPSGGGGVLASGPQRKPQFMPTMDHGASETFQHQNSGFSSSASHMEYHAPPPPQQQLTNHSSAATSAEISYRVESSVAMDNEQVKSGVNGSNLIRHSSSPAGLFSHLSVENGFDMMRNMGGFRPGNCTNGDGTLGSSRLKGQISFSSRQSSSSGLMSQIPEIGNEGLDDSIPEDRGVGHGNGKGRSYIPGLPVPSWDDTSLFSDSFSRLKRPRDPPKAQNGDVRNHFPVLSHHLSLPKNSSEMAAILQFQEAVPCKIRAKRGCATHPRSIAERASVRRTRISERMRKLQELVPNMDKQTNTADMLDLAVEYIKDLQKLAKSLSESKANCTCSSK